MSHSNGNRTIIRSLRSFAFATGENAIENIARYLLYIPVCIGSMDHLPMKEVKALKTWFDTVEGKALASGTPTYSILSNYLEDDNLPEIFNNVATYQVLMTSLHYLVGTDTPTTSSSFGRALASLNPDILLQSKVKAAEVYLDSLEYLHVEVPAYSPRR